MPLTYFADTFYWIALIFPRDAFHAAAVSFSRTLGPELSIRIGQARITGDDDAVTVGVGLGVRF